MPLPQNEGARCTYFLFLSFVYQLTRIYHHECDTEMFQVRIRHSFEPHLPVVGLVARFSFDFENPVWQ